LFHRRGAATDKARDGDVPWAQSGDNWMMNATSCWAGSTEVDLSCSSAQADGWV